MTLRNNHVFKGHRALLGSRYVTYGEVELPLRYDLFSESKSSFDWGHNGPAARQLAFSILYQVSDKEFATQNVAKFSNEVIKKLSSRDWILNASDVLKWVKTNTNEEVALTSKEEKKSANNIVSKKTKKPKTNVVKKFCKELDITQKNLAEILGVPEGTVSSWAVKNEIPRLGKKAIEFYILSKKNQDIVDSYKSFVNLLNAS